MNSPRVNFHCHTKCSDGVVSVSELVDALAKDNVKFFSLTDHDSVAGVLEAKELAKKYDMECINGIELTVAMQKDYLQFVHVLAFDFDYEILASELEILLKKEHDLVVKFAEKLAEDGYPIELKINNPHRSYLNHHDLAYGLLTAKHIDTFFNAYVEILNKEEYVDYKPIYFSPKEAIDTIHKANGLAVLAHPFDILTHSACKTSIKPEQSLEIILELNKLGLDGIEVYYKNFSDEQVALLNKWANEFGFIKSVGTDYHGKSKDCTWHCVDDEEKLLLNVIKNRK